MYRALIYRLNTRILADLYHFHVEKGALITDHVEYKLPITFHGGTPNHISRRKKYIIHNSRWKFQANHASRGWPLLPPLIESRPYFVVLTFGCNNIFLRRVIERLSLILNKLFRYMYDGAILSMHLTRTKCSISDRNNHAQLNTSTCDPSGASVPSSVWAIIYESGTYM